MAANRSGGPVSKTGTPPSPKASNPVAAGRQQDAARRRTESQQAQSRRDYSKRVMGPGGVTRRTT